MIVCICHRVSDRDIAAEVQSGCGSYGVLQDRLRVATACGACGECARATFESHHERHHGCPRGSAGCPAMSDASTAAA